MDMPRRMYGTALGPPVGHVGLVSLRYVAERLGALHCACALAVRTQRKLIIATSRAFSVFIGRPLSVERVLKPATGTDLFPPDTDAETAIPRKDAARRRYGVHRSSR